MKSIQWKSFPIYTQNFSEKYAIDDVYNDRIHESEENRIIFVYRNTFFAVKIILNHSINI